jgi:hypothetical protein
MWLEALGKAGRSLIKTTILTLILAGPVFNLVDNSKEVIRVFECTQSLAYNLTRAKVDLAIYPFLNAFSQVERNVSSINRSFKEIDDIVQPIIEEIESNRTKR